MKLILADDHVLFCEAIARYILAADPDAEVLTARDVHGVMELIDSHMHIDLVLLDLRMPGMDGLEGLKKILAFRPDIAVAILSGMAEPDDIRRAMQDGARGYFPKTMPGQALLAGIRKITGGGKFVAMDYNTDRYMPSYFSGDKVYAAPEAEGSIGGFGLTPREGQVLQFLAHGDSNKDIARALGLQIVTVKLHVRGVCRKLNVKNRTQAALKAIEAGLVVQP